ncbi:zinc finger protein 318-like [Motacilla alba alba]|uniref:zinc finger protein 318-like n=1 Tax=Motacilla alba alba TaxID=1094192 RepID=UPI0018D561C4|nr:zinc finger protein 318-like [Motacilla alba alba]
MEQQLLLVQPGPPCPKTATARTRCPLPADNSCPRPGSAWPGRRHRAVSGPGGAAPPRGNRGGPGPAAGLRARLPLGARFLRRPLPSHLVVFGELRGAPGDSARSPHPPHAHPSSPSPLSWSRRTRDGH